jgi:outer membrane receptor protein involved in Fe transport
VQNDFSIKLNSGIRDGTAKADFDYFPAPQHKIKFGGIYTYHKFTPNVVSGGQDSTIFQPNNEGVKYAGESGLYVQHDWEISEAFKLSTGLRYSTFSQMGPYTIYEEDVDGNKLDSTVYTRDNK